MLCMSFILAGLLYLINEEKQIITKETFSDFKLSSVTQFLFWENLFNEESAQVSANEEYQLLKDHYYSNGTNTLSAIMDGVIIKVEENKIIQLCDNGVSISYEKIDKVDTQKDERVLKGDILGSIEESVILHFYIDDKEITKEEALSLQ